MKIINTANNNFRLLGDIDEDEEQGSFTFQDQPQFPLTADEITAIISSSDSITKEAYSMMNLNSVGQKWMQNELSEINYLAKKIDFNSIHFAYDLGCGIGRHSIALAKQNIEVIGIDYVYSNIKQANKFKETYRLSNVNFVNADCREYVNNKKADLVLCLYDVIGTFPTNIDNFKIVKTAYNLLHIGGYAVFSVMNYESTLAHAKNIFKLSHDANRILELPPSNTMELTGNIFSPDYYLVDTETHIVYRREQFTDTSKIPKELIVRDMRFTVREIKSMCEDAGFSVLEIKCTNASGWDRQFDSTDKRAKEILVICQKNS